MRSLIQDTPTYQLWADITHTPHGSSFQLITFWPAARRSEEHVQFRGVFTTAQLEALSRAVEQALAAHRERLTV